MKSVSSPPKTDARPEYAARHPEYDVVRYAELVDDDQSNVARNPHFSHRGQGDAHPEDWSSMRWPRHWGRPAHVVAAEQLTEPLPARSVAGCSRAAWTLLLVVVLLVAAINLELRTRWMEWLLPNLSI